MFVQSGRSFHSIDINRKACGNDCFWDKWRWWMNWTWRREWTDSVLWHHRLKQDASGSIMLNWCEMMKYEIRTRDANKCFKAAQFFPARLLKKSLFLIRSQSGEVLFCKQSFLKVINCYHISAIFYKTVCAPMIHHEFVSSSIQASHISIETIQSQGKVFHTNLWRPRKQLIFPPAHRQAQQYGLRVIFPTPTSSRHRARNTFRVINR